MKGYHFLLLMKGNETRRLYGTLTEAMAALNLAQASINYYTMASLTGVDTVVSSKYGISYIAAKPFENCFS